MRRFSCSPIATRPRRKRAFEHQQFDHQALFRRSRSGAARLTPGCASTDDRQRASTAVLELPPGPVHIDCPEDFEAAGAPVATSRPFAAAAEGKPSAQRPTPSARLRQGSGAQFDGVISASRKPLLIVGLGARRPTDAAAIRSLCRAPRRARDGHLQGERRRAGRSPVLCRRVHERAIERPLDRRRATCSSASASIPSSCCRGRGLHAADRLRRPLARRRHATCRLPRSGSTDMPSRRGRSSRRMLATRTWDSTPSTRVARSTQRRAVDIAQRRASLTRSASCRSPPARLAQRSARVTVDAGAHMFPATMLWPVDEPNRC